MPRGHAAGEDDAMERPRGAAPVAASRKPELLPAPGAGADTASVTSSERTGRGVNYGNPQRLASILTAGRPASGQGGGGVISSLSIRQRVLDQAESSISLSSKEMEHRVAQEMRRMEEIGRDELSRGVRDTPEAELALQAQLVEGAALEDEVWRHEGLTQVPGRHVRQVLRPRALGKQVDPKWREGLLLKPDPFEFADHFPDRQVRGSPQVALPPVSAVQPSFAATSPGLLSSYLRADFTADDLFEMHISAPHDPE
ncbi:hypothetical protein T484DRAFT_1791815 [Baffinella frigidus]|nr:hypothetical protein T484DRAFT_1791815 [Cryptophyta sp. CCMP2293]